MSRRVRLLVFAAGLTFFIILVTQEGVQGLVTTLLRAGWAFVAIVVVWGLVYVSNTFAWLQLIRASGARPGQEGGRRSIPFLQAYAISVASFAINYATPFVALGGEPFRIASAAHWIGTDRAAASVVSFRLTHTLGQIIFWIIAVPVAWILLPPTPVTHIGLGVAALVFISIALVLISLFRRGFVVRALDATRRLPLLRRLAPRLERLRPTLEHIDSEMEVLTVDQRPRLVAAVAFEVLGRALAMVEFYIIAHAEGLHIAYGTAFVIGAFSQLAIIVTIFIPFELGSREGGLYLIYRLLGLPPSLGVYAGVVSRLRELVWIAIGLSFVWISGHGKKTAAHGSKA
jgi:hypothetical protein